MSRRVAREELFKLVFESDLTEVRADEVLTNYLERDEVELNSNERNFIEKYSKGIAKNETKIKEALTENMTGWTLDRIGSVERALLIIATYEVLFEDVPTEIVVNEVVELGKKYGDEKSYEFINGVIAKIVTSKNK